MRLNKLKGIKTAISDYNNNNNRASAFLKSKGLKFINKGSFGSVWDFGNPNWVLKIFEDDYPYMSWITFCRKNKDNPYCVKTKTRLIPIDEDKDIYGIIIERLTPVDQTVYLDLSRKIKLMEIYYDSLENKNPKEWLLNTHDKIPHIYDILTAMELLTTTNDPQIVLNRFYQIISRIESDRYLLDICKFIYTNILHKDFKPENCMMRDKQIVITDPIG